MQAGVDVFNDVGNGIIKSVVFGIVCAHIAIYVGFEAKPTPEGVAKATTTTVVASSLAVLGFDFFLTALMFN
jgi:phospholipid/cholesterol/gamma-HCH transport system permease protein